MEQEQPSPRTAARQEEQSLVDSCLRGDPRAWARFVDRFGRVVYSVPARMGLPPEACDDIFQNVFAIVLRELPSIRDRSSIPKWLMTIAHHEAYRWLRKSRPPPAPQVSQPLAEEPPEEDLIRLERQHIVQQGLDELGGRCRDLLSALFFDPAQPRYQEIARRLGIPVGAIGPTRNRCLQKLLRLLGDRLD